MSKYKYKKYSSGLTRSSNGPINTNYKFRSSYRRKFTISPKLKTKVALAQGHTMQNTEVVNGTWFGPNGSCVWAQDFLGSRIQTAQITQVVEENYAGYLVEDPNTVAGTAKRFKVKVKVLNDSSSFIVINSSNVKVTVSCYPLLPRADIHTGDTPLELLATARAGDLPEVGDQTMPYTDPRFTPFMCPELCMQYKILKPRTFTVHGGGKFNLQLRHSYDIVNYPSNVAGTGIIGKKGIYRPMLIKLVGELGVITKDSVTSLRNLPVNCVWKNNVFWQAHASTENRVIYSDLNATRNLPITGTLTGQGLIEEETLNAENFTGLSISSTS